MPRHIPDKSLASLGIYIFEFPVPSSDELRRDANEPELTARLRQDVIPYIGENARAGARHSPAPASGPAMIRAPTSETWNRRRLPWPPTSTHGYPAGSC